MDSAKNQIDTWDYSNDTITLLAPINWQCVTPIPIPLMLSITPTDTVLWNPLTCNWYHGAVLDVITGNYTSTTPTWGYLQQLEQSGQLSLQGENADIVINGVSLM
jgi:hypothetical protein